jgi:hypothetical protein
MDFRVVCWFLVFRCLPGAKLSLLLPFWHHVWTATAVFIGGILGFPRLPRTIARGYNLFASGTIHRICIVSTDSLVDLPKSVLRNKDQNSLDLYLGAPKRPDSTVVSQRLRAAGLSDARGSCAKGVATSSQMGDGESYSGPIVEAQSSSIDHLASSRYWTLALCGFLRQLHQQN